MSTDVLDRLKRIETKLVRGFEELGVGIDVAPNWLSVDDTGRVLYVSTMGRSIHAMKKEAFKKGARQVGRVYDIVHNGNCVATLTL